MSETKTRVPVPRPILYALGLLLVSQIALTVVSVAISSSNTRRAAQDTRVALQQWCSTLRVFHESYATTPPTTPAGIKIRDGLDSVYNAYHCDQVKEP